MASGVKRTNRKSAKLVFLSAISPVARLQDKREQLEKWKLSLISSISPIVRLQAWLQYKREQIGKSGETFCSLRYRQSIGFGHGFREKRTTRKVKNLFCSLHYRQSSGNDRIIHPQPPQKRPIPVGDYGNSVAIGDFATERRYRFIITINLPTIGICPTLMKQLTLDWSFLDHHDQILGRWVVLWILYGQIKRYVFRWGWGNTWPTIQVP